MPSYFSPAIVSEAIRRRSPRARLACMIRSGEPGGTPADGGASAWVIIISSLPPSAFS